MISRKKKKIVVTAPANPTSGILADSDTVNSAPAPTIAQYLIWNLCVSILSIAPWTKPYSCITNINQSSAARAFAELSGWLGPEWPPLVGPTRPNHVGAERLPVLIGIGSVPWPRSGPRLVRGSCRGRG